ncbi:MAG: class I SAM-dependent methyltransferase [Candidatus Latescibacteria bacterium]|nr:class I SAM-dependent methyltransferase [Candidatus Latescibacterota bacterium]
MLVIVIAAGGFAYGGTSAKEAGLDMKVEEYLKSHEGAWRDMNVPAEDGRALYDIILENGYTRALEIGTSTGLSGIWIAWALSKTGGRLVTIEIDEGRRREALEHFREAGLAGYIDARLADAHELVRELEGPFDFVFSDADKGWYKNYLEILMPKIEVGGCFTAHNVRNGYAGVGEFLDYLESLPNMKTELVGSRRAGVSVSYKTGD